VLVEFFGSRRLDHGGVDEKRINLNAVDAVELAKSETAGEGSESHA
jgi:hypothetical protein